MDSREDMMIYYCFRTIGLQCIDTNDEWNETRYHVMDAEFHASWNRRKPANWVPQLLESQGIANLNRMGQISKWSVSFHLKPIRDRPNPPIDLGMRRYYALLYGNCT